MVIWPCVLIVVYLLLVAALSILASQNRSMRPKWLTALLWSLLFALIFSPGRWMVGPEGEGALLLPAPFAMAVYVAMLSFGREHVTLSGVIYAAKTFVTPFAICWGACFLFR